MKPADMISELHRQGVVTDLDKHFTDFIMKTAPNPNPELELASVLVSTRMREGHICLDLNLLAGQKWPDAASSPAIQCYQTGAWCDALYKTGMVGNPGDKKPLVLDQSNARLYLYRYWHYQQELADSIRQRAEIQHDLSEHAFLSQRMNQLFMKTGDDEIDWQKTAAFTALFKNFCVITGGPGTGKTFTVANILALMIETHLPQTLRIALAAPTGKAAARLKEAVRQAKLESKAPEIVKAAMPDDASTIHRLLGTISDSPYFRHNADYPLSIDILAVDEASMVDLPLMAKLISALPPNARLLLLGDKDQLASVEPGAVLGDICGTHQNAADAFSDAFSKNCRAVTGHQPSVTKHASSLDDCIVELKKGYRFKGDSGIKVLSRATNKIESPGGEQALQRVIHCVRQGQYPDVQQFPAASVYDARGLHDDFKQTVKIGLAPYLEAMAENRSPDVIFQAFSRFRILCALRKGPFGVEQINLLTERLLQRNGLIKAGLNGYKGRPVMITRNDYNLKLFNGDIGLTWPAPDTDELRVYFPDEDGRMRPINPRRLPEHETVYAMTVHKSQGSEFENLLLLLPDRQSPVLTRELVYTGLTRAKKNVTLFADQQILINAARRPILRSSGLRELL